jgi:hypothetical protein
MKPVDPRKSLREWREFVDPRQPGLFDEKTPDELVLTPSPKPERPRRRRKDKKP